MISFIFLCLSALAGYTHQPDLAVSDGDFKVAVIGDAHVGSDLVEGPYPVETLRIALELALAIGADAAILTGDLAGEPCFAGRDEFGVPIHKCLTGTEPGRLPRPEEAAEVYAQMVASGFPLERIYYLSGNHDGGSGWLTPYLDMLLADGVKAAAPGTTHDSYYVRMRLECPADDVVVDWVMMGDRNRTQDYGACGSLVTNESELTVSGMPATSYDLDQLDFLRSRILRSAELGHSLALSTHVPPPETTFGTWEGEGREHIMCGAVSLGALHGPAPVVTLDERPSASWASPHDGLTVPERCDAWNGTSPLMGEDATVRKRWPAELIGQAEAEGAVSHSLRLWTGSHSHVHEPDFEQGGHGMDALLYPDGGGAAVQVVQTGGITRHHGGKGASSIAVVSWDCSGGYEVERWPVLAPWAPSSCSTAWRPSTLGVPYPNTPKITGSW